MSIGIDVRNPLPTIGILALQGRVYADFVFQVSKTSLNPNSNWNCRKRTTSVSMSLDDDDDD